MKVVRSGDLVSYTAEEGVRILGEGKFLVSDSFPGNQRTKYCLTSKVMFHSFASAYEKSYTESCENNLLFMIYSCNSMYTGSAWSDSGHSTIQLSS